MNREIASDLLLTVNSPDSYEALKAYAAYRIGSLCNQLATTSDYNEICRVQGQIKELKRVLTLREEVLQAMEDTKNGN